MTALPSFFSDDTVLEDRIRRYSEPTFAFMRVCAWPSFARIRDQWDRWLSEYPESKRPGLVKRFQSPSNHQHLSAALELFTHAALFKHGFHIAVEPEVGKYMLEFLAKSENDYEFYVECTVTSKGNLMAAADALEAEFLDSLNKTASKNYMLGLTVEERGGKAPSAKVLRTELSKWLDSLDESQSVVEDLPWNYEGWKVKFHALPVTDREGSDAAIGMTIHTDWVDEAPRIRRALDFKASKYGSLDRPLVVVVGSTELQSDDDLFGAILGDKVWQIDTLTKKVTEARKRNGAFLDLKGPRNTDMSAVLHAPFTSHSFASTESAYTITHHPYASLPFPHGIFPFAEERWFDHDGSLVRRPPACSVAEFFGLNEEWPHFSSDPHRGG